VNRRCAFLIGVLFCAMSALGGVAGAQVSVAVTSAVAISVGPGSNISNAGTFTVTNNSGAGINISAVTISASDAAIFSSMTLTGQVPGSSAVAALSSPNPPSSSNTFNFPSLPVLPNGQAATFTLSAVAASAAAPTPTPSSSALNQRRWPVRYAAMVWSENGGQPKAPSLLLTAVALGMLLMTGRMRRRHLVVLAMALILAATEAGCGNNTANTGTSTQIVQTVSVSSGGAPTGLPASLGSITVQ
jgi:hypothetical protein